MGRACELTRNDHEIYIAPLELRKIATERIQTAQRQMEQRYDKKRAGYAEYQVGDIVYMKVAPMATGKSTKLLVKYRGSLVIIQPLPGDTTLIVSPISTKARWRDAMRLPDMRVNLRYENLL